MHFFLLFFFCQYYKVGLIVRIYNYFQLFVFQPSMPMKKLPQFGGQDIDLYLLYKTVTNFGGWLKVKTICIDLYSEIFNFFIPLVSFPFVSFLQLMLAFCQLKVTDDRKWHEVAKNFNLPPSCLNSAFALRQLYVR